MWILQALLESAREKDNLFTKLKEKTPDVALAADYQAQLQTAKDNIAKLTNELNNKDGMFSPVEEQQNIDNVFCEISWLFLRFTKFWRPGKQPSLFCFQMSLTDWRLWSNLEVLTQTQCQTHRIHLRNWPSGTKWVSLIFTDQTKKETMCNRKTCWSWFWSFWESQHLGCCLSGSERKESSRTHDAPILSTFQCSPHFGPRTIFSLRLFHAMLPRILNKKCLLHRSSCSSFCGTLEWGTPGRCLDRTAPLGRSWTDLDIRRDPRPRWEARPLRYATPRDTEGSPLGVSLSPQRWCPRLHRTRSTGQAPKIELGQKKGNSFEAAVRCIDPVYSGETLSRRQWTAKFVEMCSWNYHTESGSLFWQNRKKLAVSHCNWFRKKRKLWLWSAPCTS